MSKVKTPTDKKRLSLERDRRNTYGENPHASRKNIRRGKQRLHREERREANQLLLSTTSVPGGQEDVEDVQSKIKVSTRVNRLKGFKKVPDQPLGEVIEGKLRKRKKAGMNA